MSDDLLRRAVDQLDRLIAGIRPDQGGDLTPCASWDVDTLVAHVVAQTWQFADAPATGGFRAAGDALLARRPERSDPWQITRQTVELATHAWDIAKATGQPTDLDPEVGRVALDFARANIKLEHRGDEASGAFMGPEAAVAADAPVYDRLAAFMGRDPA
jgi:hypothetical protein